MTISVILIDDHPLFRKGLSHLLEAREEGITVAGQFAEIAGVVNWLKEGGRAEVALLDRNLGEEDGLTLVPELKKNGLKVIMLTVADEAHEIRQAIDRGVDGYVSKTSDPAQILQAIATVARGSGLLHSTVMDETMREKLASDISSKLSGRELEIVHLVAQGMSNKAIGDKLGLSDNTVRNHLASILEKLGFENRVQVATFAMKHGIGRIPSPSE